MSPWSNYDLKVCSEVLPKEYQITHFCNIESIPIYGCFVLRQDVLSIRQLLRRVSAKSGLYPVITPLYNSMSLEDFGEWLKYFELATSVEAIGSKAVEIVASLNARSIFQDLENYFIEENSLDWKEYFGSEAKIGNIASFEWQHFQGTENHFSIILLPIKEPWQAALFILRADPNREHGWEKHPIFSGSSTQEEYKLAQLTLDLMVCKHWWNNYKAELVIFGSNGEFEWLAWEPPSTFKNALKLAKEQFLYCNDVIEQHHWFLNNGEFEIFKSGIHLAKVLQLSDKWALWWD